VFRLCMGFVASFNRYIQSVHSSHYSKARVGREGLAVSGTARQEGGGSLWHGMEALARHGTGWGGEGLFIFGSPKIWWEGEERKKWRVGAQLGP
jgi:hypothetical protein